MTTYDDQVDRKLPEVAGSWPEVPVHPKHFPYLLDEPYARELQAQGAFALRFLYRGGLLLPKSFLNDFSSSAPSVLWTGLCKYEHKSYAIYSTNAYAKVTF